MLRRWTENALFVPELNDQTQAWLRSHGIEPVDVLMNGIITEQGGKITVETIKRDEDGNMYWHDETDGFVRAPITEFTEVSEWPPEHLTEEVS